jgi:hypothetical protein
MQSNLTFAVVAVAVAAGYLSGWGGKILGEAEEMAWYRQGLEAGGNLIFTKVERRHTCVCVCLCLCLCVFSFLCLCWDKI